MRLFMETENYSLTNPQKQTALSLVLKCGISPSHKGCFYFADAVELFAQNRQPFYSIYKQIADKHGVKCKTVTRSMSYAISQARYVCSNLSELIGLKFQKPDVYNSSVIAYLGTYLKYCG